MNTGILLSGFKPEFSLIVQAITVLPPLLTRPPAMLVVSLSQRELNPIGGRRAAPTRR